MKNKKCSVAFYAGAVYAFRSDRSATRNLYLSLNPSESHHNVAFPSARERGVIAKNAGFYLDFRLKSCVFLDLGLNYTQVFYQTKDNTTFYITSKGNASPLTFYSNTKELQIKERYYFISVPICVSYRFNRGKLAYSFGAGASLAVYKNEIIEGYGNNSTTYDQTPRDFNDKKHLQRTGTLFAKFGIYHHLSNHIVVGLEPEFKFYMLYERLYTAGLDMVLKF